MGDLPVGVIAAACTPIDKRGWPDLERLTRHVELLHRAGCVGVLVAGTTGEGSAFPLATRREMVEAVAALKLGWSVFAATGATTIDDTTDLTVHALDCGVVPVVLPPRVEGASEAGLVSWYQAVLGSVPTGAGILLYNLPSLAGISLSINLIQELCAVSAGRIIGLKDSSGDRAYLHEIRHRLPDLPLYLGHEPLVVDGLLLGARGALSGLANVAPRLLVEAVEAAARGDLASSLDTHRRIVRIWAAFNSHQPYPAAFKGVLARQYQDSAWTACRPPLVATSSSTADALLVELEAVAGGLGRRG